MTRILRNEFQEFQIHDRFEVADDAEVIFFSGVESAMDFLRQFGQSRFDLMTMRDLIFSASDGIDLSGVSNNELIERLAVKLASGEVNITRRASRESDPVRISIPKKSVVSQPKPKRAAPAPAPAQAKTASSWLEVELLDEEGNLIHGEPYEVELPDGSRRTGKLNQGYVYIGGIKEGTCKLTFPQLDQDAWSQAN